MRTSAAAAIVVLFVWAGPSLAAAGQPIPSAAEDTEAAYQTAADSTSMCYFAELRKEIKQEIATEKRYAAEGGGAINLSKMYELQRKMRYLDEAIETIRSALHDRTVKPLPCSSDVVQKLALCVAWRIMNTFPRGSPADAVERFCAAQEMRDSFDLVDLGEKAPYWNGADQAIINIAYELDGPHLLARSAEVCLGEKYAAIIDSKLKASKPSERGKAERFVLMIRKSRDELEQAGLEPLPCDRREVQQLLTCVMEKGDDVGVKQGCRSAELKAAMQRLQRE